MKKTALISGMVLAVFLFVSHGLYAQRFYRYCPAIEGVYYDLNLTEKQLEEIDKLEIGLEKELSPLISKLRSQYGVLDELEAQRNPDPTKINAVWDAIYKLEDDIQNKEILHENKIRGLLTEEQRAVFDAYFAYGTNPYGKGGFDRGYFGSGFRGGRRGLARGYDRTVGYFGRGAGFGRGYRWNYYRMGWKR